MWKTGESPRGGAVFCPHPTVETFNSFHRACERNFCPDFFHRLSFHISQGLWRKFGVWQTAQRFRPRVCTAPHQSRPFGPRQLPPGEAILQAGVNIGRNGLNVLLDGFVAVFQGYLHLADGIEHCGMVLGKLLADVGQA